MKDKILSAIDKGLMNVLSADIQDQDIDFDTDKINTEYIPEISLDELYKMFSENKEGIFATKFNTKNALSLILVDNSEISLYQYEKGMLLKFLKITYNGLGNDRNEILIYMPGDHLIVCGLKWQTNYKPTQSNFYLTIQGSDAINDFDGYDNCQRIIGIKKKDITINVPAISYCMSKNIPGYQGYLPSMGQLKIMDDYLDLINYVIKKTDIGHELKINSNWWWSSNESTNGGVWCMESSKPSYFFKSNDGCWTFPVFKPKKY